MIKFTSCILVILLFMAMEGTYSETLNITCDVWPKTDSTCQNEALKIIMDETKKGTASDVEINIKMHQLQLNTTLNFTNFNTLIIRGEPNITNIACTHNIGGAGTRAGIVISSINGTVTLQNLNLSFCGSKINNNFGRDSYVKFYSALTISRCKNVEINNVIIERSEGLGLVLNSTQGDHVTITSAKFSKNEMPQGAEDQVYGGGGVYVLLNNSAEFQSQSSSWPPTTVLFRDCWFTNNTARTKHYKFIYNDIKGQLYTGQGRGGGLYMYVSSGLKNAHISFMNCKFISNHAFIGGGLSVIVRGQNSSKTENVSVEIVNTLFQWNGFDGNDTTDHVGQGGGVHITFKTVDNSGGILDAHYLLHNVNFSNNYAEMGGAMFYYSTPGPQEFRHANSMLLNRCIFEHNEAHIGSAVAVTPGRFSKLSSGYIVVPTFQDCSFSNNSVFEKKSLDDCGHTQRIAGTGTIYASFYDTQFEGQNTFHSNKGTAIYVYNGIVNITNSDMTFVNNQGINGGAMGLIGSSVVVFGPKRYEFHNNSGHWGGAVYVSLLDNIDFVSSKWCFFQYKNDDSTMSHKEKNTTNIIFVGNRAKTAGHAIYTTSLWPCQVEKQVYINRTEYAFIKTSNIFGTQGFNFDDDATLQPQIATDGAILHSTLSPPLLIIPGQKFKHGVVITDELGHHVKASFRVEVKYNKHVELESAISAYIGEEIQLRGVPNENATLFMQIVSPRQSYILLNITLLECPIGFAFNDTTSRCVCNDAAYVSITRCDLDSFHSLLLPGFWIGHIKSSNRTKLVTCRCPFCDYDNQVVTNMSDSDLIVLPHKHSDLNKAVCGDTRTGIVCGECAYGYTVHFHSLTFLCKRAEPVGCKLGWLFYILSELIPITLVFITVLVLNISITSGTVNGFILFGQLLDTFDIDASGIISYSESAKYTIKGWIQRYRFIYGFFNLNFFESEYLSFCLWNGASALDILAVKYVTILYALLLIVAVIWIMNKCGGRCCGKFCRITTIRTSVVHGISTFLVICYAKCVQVSLNLLIPIWLEKRGFDPPARVWLNGELLYFSKRHLPYALPAIFCLLIIGLFPPALLLAYPLGCRVMTVFGCDNIKAIIFFSEKLSISSLKPLLDSIQGCFKDNLRFFAGLYFLYRWIIPFTHVIANGFGIYYSILGGVLFFILLLHTICQPYIKGLHNIIDALLFVNLILINSLSFYNYYNTRTQWGIQEGVTVSPVIIQLILIYLPMIVVGVYILAIFLKKIAQLQSCGLLNKIVTALNSVTQIKIERLRDLISALDLSKKVEEEEIHDWLMDQERDFMNMHVYHAS